VSLWCPACFFICECVLPSSNINWLIFLEHVAGQRRNHCSRFSWEEEGYRL
jgi:hypothetical protein